MKVVVASTHLGEDFIERLRHEFAGIHFAAAYTPADAAREAREAEAFFGWPDRRIFETARKLQWIACPGAGVDRIVVVEEIVNSTVVLTNAPGPHVAPMADWSLGVMIALAHRFAQSWHDQQKKAWRSQDYDGKIVELRGRVCGIYGLGAIGRAVAHRAAAFEMKVIAVDPHPREVPGTVAECWPFERLDDLCRSSDFVVVTAPYVPATRRSIDRRRISLLRPSSYLVVVSRGGIVDEAALADALHSGRLAGAALDATETEPLPESSPIWTAPNTIVTPHVSALSPELYEGRRAIFIENLRRFISGSELLHTVDKRAGY